MEYVNTVSLELGGNLSIVFPDVDTNDDFIDQLLLSTAYTGRARAARLSRLFLHQDIYDDVLGRHHPGRTRVRGGVQLALANDTDGAIRG
nr:aldehyde dehydrogenase family protein [Rhodococcus wratislaviensis]GLK34651.1 hypothetical protein GCM10017611_15000 [Rhodococcus wratislaviensis]